MQSVSSFVYNGIIIIHTDTEVLGAGLEERVLLGLGAFAGAEGSGGGLLTGGLGLGRLVIETDT